MSTSATTTITATDSVLELQPRTTQNFHDEHPPADAVIAESLLADSSVPEGGYGWVVVACCAILIWWGVGTTYCWGIIQGALVKDGLASPFQLSFVGGLAISLNSFQAMISARIIRKTGVRNAAVAGVCLLASGEFLAGFCTRSLPGLFVTAGLLVGNGLSLCFMASSTVTAQWFARKRGLANGIIFAGGGLGGGAISFATNAFINRFGLAWNFRIMGCIMLITGLPAAWSLKERNPTRRTVFVDWKLFKDTSFVLLLLFGGLVTFPLVVTPFFLPLYAESIGLSVSTGAALVAGFNFSSALGRILSGFLADIIGPVNSLFIGMILNALSILVIWPISETIVPLVFFVVLNGMANGSFFSTMPTVVGALYGSVRVAVAMGMIVTSWGGGYLLGAPIAGFLLEAFGGTQGGFKSYRPAIFYAGGLAIISVLLLGILRLWKDKRLLCKV